MAKDKNKIAKNQSSTPYDDVFRTMLNDCTRFVLPLLNEVFGEHYDGSEKIIMANDYHFKNMQDGREEKIITDSSFKVVNGDSVKKYHLECQSTIDNSMSLRFFEYDAQIALDEAVFERENVYSNVLILTFPHSAVLFLRSNDNVSDVMNLKLVTPGGNISYGIPVIKMQRYSLADIWEKDMYLLIPFYIFTHEANFKIYNNDKELLQNLLDEFIEICDKLNKLAIEQKITEFEKRTIIELSKKVIDNIATKYDNIREGVDRIMGGTVIETEAKRILNSGKILGVIEILKDMNMTEEQITEHIVKKFGLSEEDAKKKIKEVSDDQVGGA